MKRILTFKKHQNHNFIDNFCGCYDLYILFAIKVHPKLNIQIYLIVSRIKLKSNLFYFILFSTILYSTRKTL